MGKDGMKKNYIMGLVKKSRPNANRELKRYCEALSASQCPFRRDPDPRHRVKKIVLALRFLTIAKIQMTFIT